MGPAQAESAGAAESAWTNRSGGAGDSYLRDREAQENFPVALRVLPRRYRVHLSAVYDVVRVIDDLGDEAGGDRVQLLENFRADLARIWHGGEPASAVGRRLTPTVAACGLTEAPFHDLVQANLQDQRVTSYATWDDLVAYCALSANPIGRLVLDVFGQSNAHRAEMSDQICTALQVVEHCQDVAEDSRAGRVYLPVADLERFGVGRSGLTAAPASDALRKVVATQIDRCAGLMSAGLPLIGELRGWARLAVAGYAAGGLAAMDAIRKANYDVISTHCRAKRNKMVKHLLEILYRGRSGR
jgi:squalene synthase HpnC